MRKFSVAASLFVCLLGFIVLLAIALPSRAVTQAANSTDQQNFAQIERGRYLTAASDCAACHTVPGGPPFAGGRAIETPFGIVAAPNITPDRDTGIGGWSDALFSSALREGRGWGGELLYPAMPYPAYTKMSQDDVLAIRAYLNTVAPVMNKVVSNQLAFPFNVRTALLAWNALYFTPGEFTPDNNKSAEWNRGSYLVQGAGHCGTCHTPKTILGGDKTSEPLQGYAIQGWLAPGLTGDQGTGGWSLEDIVAYLKAGHNRITAATGPMAEVVSLSSSRMSDSDLHAIATYLKDLPGPKDNFSPLPANDPVVTAGANIYRDACSACHAMDGHGIAYLFPSLAASSSIRSTDQTTVIRIILRGARSVATATEPTGPAMPAFGWQLNDDQVAAVATYIRNSWGSAAPAVTADQVGRARATLASRTD